MVQPDGSVRYGNTTVIIRHDCPPGGEFFEPPPRPGRRRDRVTRSARMAIKNVGVIGCGLMGSGIVQVAAQAGFSVLFVEANDELVKRGLGRLRETLDGLAARGKLDAKRQGRRRWAASPARRGSRISRRATSSSRP